MLVRKTLPHKIRWTVQFVTLNCIDNVQILRKRWFWKSCLICSTFRYLQIAFYFLLYDQQFRASWNFVWIILFEYENTRVSRCRVLADTTSPSPCEYYRPYLVIFRQNALFLLSFERHCWFIHIKPELCFQVRIMKNIKFTRKLITSFTIYTNHVHFYWAHFILEI